MSLKNIVWLVMGLSLLSASSAFAVRLATVGDLDFGDANGQPVLLREDSPTGCELTGIFHDSDHPTIELKQRMCPSVNGARVTAVRGSISLDRFHTHREGSIVEGYGPDDTVVPDWHEGN